MLDIKHRIGIGKLEEELRRIKDRDREERFLEYLYTMVWVFR